ncbi:Enzyme that catalyzes the fourth step in the histidine pathway [Xylographa soralifera]|nr:Enzyme that catalyzes the fourth step in the histidine pathway [Xylographa soralifera]
MPRCYFRPCIDLHAGQVKQIVGGTLNSPASPSALSTPSLQTNHISHHPPSYFASLYKKHNLWGGHVIMLGPGNEDAAMDALQAWPGGLHVGGGIKDTNAAEWIGRGAEKVIVTSYLFPDARSSMERLRGMLAALGGDRQKLVIDLSCRRQQSDDGRAKWVVAMDKWQRLTDMEVNAESIAILEPYCSEFLIHAADVEGLQNGIDQELVRKLGEWCSIPVTYAGGGSSIRDLELVERLANGHVDLTIGSALDIFGGSGVKLEECVEWNQRQSAQNSTHSP